MLEFFFYMLLIAFSEKILADPLKLPPPDPRHQVRNPARVLGWKNNSSPKAPPQFSVTKFAEGLHHSRWIYVAPNGDIFLAESRSNQITILRDANHDGIPEIKQVFQSGLKLPFGMLILNNFFYVANTDSIIRFPYKSGSIKIESKGEKIKELPSGGHHWTRNIVANKKGDRIYVSVGSSSNVAEYGILAETRRAAILEMSPDGQQERIYAHGLRNPVGMDWQPEGLKLWCVVNERDNLGDDLVPDYLTELSPGNFYGWPYAYWGKNADPRLHGQRMDLVQKALVPDVSLGAHVAPLGLAFYPQHAGVNAYPSQYHNGAFVGLHGSWNRSTLAGYKVVFIPFRKGKPFGPPEDFLHGFIANSSKSEVYGRPVGVAVLSDGSLLVADDASNILWKVTYKK